jgi:MFS family permease
MMQAVGEAWLMTSLVISSLIVALAWASDSLSIVALALPAGALADIVDRRRLLLLSQSWMFAVALILGIITLLGLVSPLVLLVLIFLLGLGEAVSTPAFPPFLLGTVPRKETRNALTLNGVATNIGRGIGPAVGGLLVAGIGPGAVFVLNALSFVGIIVVLLQTGKVKKRVSTAAATQQLSPLLLPPPSAVPPYASLAMTTAAKTTGELPAERMLSAIRVGLRYIRNTPPIHTVFIRVIAFAISATALPAILPSLSRRVLAIDSTGYGILFALFGIGAIIGGIVIVPRAINNVSSPDKLIVTATVLFAISLIVLSFSQNLFVLGAAMVVAGIAQLMSYSTFSFVLYRTLPSWVMSRVASVYQLVLQAAIVGGSILWGAVADIFGIKIALLFAGVALAIGLATKAKLPLASDTKVIDVSPSLHYPSPPLSYEPGLSSGPVLVQVEYKIDPKRIKEFIIAMNQLGAIRKRDGAFF